jgi:hypothetical protein
VVTTGIGVGTGVVTYQLSSGEHTLNGYLGHAAEGMVIPQTEPGVIVKVAGRAESGMKLTEWVLYPIRHR